MNEKFRRICERLSELEKEFPLYFNNGNSKKLLSPLSYELIPHVKISNFRWERSSISSTKIKNSHLVNFIQGVIVLKSEESIFIERLPGSESIFSDHLLNLGLVFDTKTTFERNELKKTMYTIVPEIKISWQIRAIESDETIEIFSRNGGGEWGNRTWKLNLEEMTNLWLLDFFQWCWTGKIPESKK